jgi:hypothetical protein
MELYWSNELSDDPVLWERIAGASATPGATAIALPPRTDGFWLIWLTELSTREDGSYQTSMAELRFLP